MRNPIEIIVQEALDLCDRSAVFNYITVTLILTITLPIILASLLIKWIIRLFRKKTLREVFEEGCTESEKEKMRGW